MTTLFARVFFGVMAIATVIRSGAEGIYSNSWVRPSARGNLLYRHDAQGVRICDFSGCGYKSGIVEIPDVTRAVPPERWIFVYPAQGLGNDADNIQNALNAAAASSNLVNGFRAVVYLDAGEYHLDRTLRITNSGIVLKGAGTSEDTGTRLWATNHMKYTLLEVLGPDPQMLLGPTKNFSQLFVPAGTRTFKLDNTEGLTNGSRVVITRTFTENWISAIDMDKLEATVCNPFPNCITIGAGKNWTTNMPPQQFERHITRIEGLWVTVDTPLPQSFDWQYGGGILQQILQRSRLENIGVEDLLMASSWFTLPNGVLADEDHAWIGIQMTGTENAWVRRVVGKHFGMSTVSLGVGARQVTVAACTNLEPKTFLGSNKRYSFHMDKGDHNLIRDCYAKDGRHDYAFSSLVPGPNANVRCRAMDARADSGPHQKWSTGGLYDLIDENGTWFWELIGLVGINVQNRGRNSSGHGWAGAFMTVWNCNSPKYRVRNPPTARNWLIGSIGDIGESQWWLPPVGDDPAGTYEWSGSYYVYGMPPGFVQPQEGFNGRHVDPYSLYFAQLQQRLRWPNSEFREYWFGDIDDFNGLNLEDFQPVDSNYLAQVQQQTGGGLEVSQWFDRTTLNRQVVFTCTVPLTGAERVMAASLVLSLRAVGPGSANDLLYLDSATNGIPLRQGGYGWEIPESGAAVQTIEIDPAMLSDGKLNVSIKQNIAVDWAVLHAQVTPSVVTLMPLVPIDDAFARGGSHEHEVNGTNILLTVKNEDDGNNSRRGYLRWRLPLLTRPLMGATVRLFCEESPQAGNVFYAAPLATPSWSEQTLTWTNQPDSLPPIAYFVAESQKVVEFSVLPQALVTPGGARSAGLSLQIWAPYDLGDAGFASFATKEHPDPAKHPQLILHLGDYPPTMTPVSHTNMAANTQLNLPIQVSDNETPAGSLVLTGTSSNPALIPNANLGITPGSSVNERILTITPVNDRTGLTQVALFLSDGVQTNAQKFTVRVGLTNIPPVISNIPDQMLTEDISSPRIAFSIADAYGRAHEVQTSYSITALAPAGKLPPLNVTFGTEDDPNTQFTTNSQRYLIITPAPEHSGTNTLTLRFTDGFGSVSQDVEVVVLRVDDPPGPISVNEPAQGTTFLPGQPLMLEATVIDREKDLARVEFYHAGTFLGVDTTRPYQCTWTNPPAGYQPITAVVFDQAGQEARSVPAMFVIGDDFEMPPALAISPEGTDLVRLTWETDGQNVQLQSSEQLGSAAVWTNLNVVIPPDTNTVTLLRQGTGAFYRLIVVP